MSNRGSGGWYQGSFIPTNQQKCLNESAIQYRSSWEKRFCTFLDNNPAVKKWAFEKVTIPYIYEIDNTAHRYIVDFYVEIMNQEGKIDKYLVEIKPKHQTAPPKMPKKKSAKSMKNYEWQLKAYVRNKNKWDATEKFCLKNGLKFKLITEETVL